jgi:ribosomal protein S18 acetylase RimI-like enzyme
MGDSLAIGPGRPADVDACVALWVAAVGARDEHPAPIGTIERCGAKFSRAAVSFVIARSRDGIVGFGLVTAPVDDPGDAAYLALLAVSPRAQGRGLGSRLLDVLTAETRGRASGTRAARSRAQSLGGRAL